MLSRMFALHGPDWLTSAFSMPATAVAVSATSEIGDLHQLRNHAHHVAAAGAAEHAHEVAAAHPHAVTLRFEARAATEAAGWKPWSVSPDEGDEFACAVGKTRYVQTASTLLPSGSIRNAAK
jgi:hypothetical protein